MEDRINKIYNLLYDLSQKGGNEFSGAGIIVYDSKKLSPNYYCSLRPELDFEAGLYLGDSNLNDFLFEIGQYSSPFHDGFHMINEEGELKHIAQYFATPINCEISPNPNHGARVFSSICGSLLKGIFFIGVVSSNGKVYIFRDGKEVKINSLNYISN